ncbi:MAG: T9SS type A sorting domain-containing protein [Bacteroidota bacterium]
MSVRNRNKELLLVILFFTGMVSAGAQVEFPGKPVGINRQLKAAELMYVLPPLNPLELEAAIQENSSSTLKPFHFALERTVDLRPESHGSWDMEGNVRIWRIHILSPEARSMGLVFNTYRLEPGVKVFIYDPDMKQVKGAFTSGNNKVSGILPVGHVPGEELIVEMQVPSGLENYGILRIESISHAYKDVGQMLKDKPPAGSFGGADACNIDINCSEGNNWQLTKRSVVRIFTTRQYCTGVLINNTSYDGTPYILTAEHCLNKQYYADRTVFQFNYESPTCFGPDGPLNMSISAAELISVGDSIDFSLVKLSLTPPENFDVYYAGWDRSDFQTTASKTIHHPWGDVKKISSDYEAPSKPAQPGDVPYSDLDDYHYYSFWWIRGWDEGSTEGGSSGGPLFNAGQKVIGTLSGGFARCGDSIDYDYEKDRVIYSKALNYDDYYTRMSMSWDYEEEKGFSLKPWLDPGNTGHEVVDGYEPVGIGPELKVSNTHFTLFPNPVGNELHIANVDYLPGPVNYTIYSLSGAPVLSGKLDGVSEPIPTVVLPDGLYVIRIANSGFMEHLKFIVAR